jgi:hypothetical protein
VIAARLPDGIADSLISSCDSFSTEVSFAVVNQFQLEIEGVPLQ